MAQKRAKTKEWTGAEEKILKQYAKAKVQGGTIPKHRDMAQEVQATLGQFKRKWQLIYAKAKIKYDQGVGAVDNTTVAEKLCG
eukprot:CAMPEP_0174268464 /NCGR_PEP_ID=MMETSP0439-20130205/37582_1 /TAXON_ID=0 /ORGANISM="Stereomyxa ramosa, Strain Chinc5" /LENGTH=82 /DNA_ID=CAMNT_0015356661 /DNA_START=19 /DNA_END=263 /DNA_ORIENTATION=-